MKDSEVYGSREGIHHPGSVAEEQYNVWRQQVLDQKEAKSISLDDEHELDIAQKRLRLRKMCALLDSYTDKENSENPFKKYVENLTKKIDSPGYLDVPAHELDDMAKLTFVLIFDWKCKNGKELGVSEVLHQKVSTYGHDLAKTVTARNWARIAGGIALGLLGLALVVGAGCMIGASYGALSPFAVTVAKFGLGISSVGAAYVFAELMGQAVPAVYHKLRTKDKTESTTAADKKESTTAAMIELAGTARDNSVAQGAAGIIVGSALTTGAAILSGTANAAITSTVIPTASVAATSTLAVAGTMAAMASTIGAGFMAMYRGTLFVRDAAVRKQIHHVAVDALNVNKPSVGRSNTPA